MTARRLSEDELRSKVIYDFKKRYPLFNKDQFLFIIQNDSLSEVRKLATAFLEYPDVKSNEQMEIRRALNNFARERIGADYCLFREILKEQSRPNTKEVEIYKILQLGVRLDREMKASLKSFVYLKYVYVGAILSPCDLPVISRLFHQGAYPELVTHFISWNTAKNKNKTQEMINDTAVRSCYAWLKFCTHILTGDYECAYAQLVHYQEEYKDAYGEKVF